jgi:23S rRNA (adenine2503-C2)-methyltransferase
LTNKKNLLGYSLRSLEDFFKSLDEPSFRAKQLSKWIHQKGVTDFNLMTDFNKDLRSKLIEVRNQLEKKYIM